MKISDDVNYMKNELKSYIYLKDLVVELKIKQKKELFEKEEQIKILKEEINQSWIKSPSFDRTSTSSFSNDDKILKLIVREETLEDEIKEINQRYDFWIKSYQERIIIIEKALTKINDDEKAIIDDLFFKNRSYNKVSNEHHYSSQYLYKKVEKIIKKMV